MEFWEVIRTRRSVRSFKPDPIPEEKLRTVLDAARLAPSGSNRQPTRFIVITKESQKRALVPMVEGQEFVAEAPVVIAACGRNIHFNRGGYMGDMSMLVDVAIAFDHLTLAARAEGLGTCWIGSFDNESLKKALSIPEDYQVVALTPLGFPRAKDAFRPSDDRLGLDDITFWGGIWGK